jgi:hypothetical protein
VYVYEYKVYEENAVEARPAAALVELDLMYVGEGMTTSELLMDTPMAAIEVKVYVF